MTEREQLLLEDILGFVDQSNGLSTELNKDGYVSVHQSVDGKSFRFSVVDLTEVLKRVDSDGQPFIQVNFTSGRKVLFTDNLVGFKPCDIGGLDMNKIPKVVTTPDLLSVFEAIEEGLSSEQVMDHEVDILKKVYQSILTGGEEVGFDLAFEKKWLSRLVPCRLRVTA